MPSTSRRRAAPEERTDHIILVLGRPGTGKSTWCRGAIAAERGNVLAWDPTDAFGAREGRDGWLRWDFQGRARELVLAQANARKRIARARVWGTDADFVAVCELLKRAGDALFVVDEAHMVLPVSITTRHPFRDLLLPVRHLRMGLILVAWRPYNLAAFTRSGVSRVVAFQLNDARSIEWLKAEAGASDELAAKLPGLPTGKERGTPRCFDWRL